MRRNIAFFTLACTLAIGVVAAEEKGKGSVVSLDGLQSRTPGDWKEEAPLGSLRFKQFLVPHAKDDKSDGELVIFKAGGGARANVERWKGQWAPPEGKKIADVAVVSEMKIAGKPAVLLEIEGTYRTAPFDPKHKGAQLPGYRMLAVYFEGPDNPYQIKFTGPSKTVGEHKKAFEDWLKAFK